MTLNPFESCFLLLASGLHAPITPGFIQSLATAPPLWRAAGFFLATFVLEDVATIGAGLLLATGALSWPVAFWACFLGIWWGDAGLYALARLAGRSWFERSSWKRFDSKVRRSEQWFATHGTPILIFSRMLPGARLPTYLAAGFLRWPLDRFLFVTGAASLVWTIVVLAASLAAGTSLLRWLGEFKQAGWILPGILVLIWGLVSLGRGWFTKINRQKAGAKFGRWLRWEFWPGWMFYPPVGLHCIWLSIKYRGFTVPTAANPGMVTGGIVGESKAAILEELSATNPEFTAEARLLSGNNPVERLRSLEQIQEQLSISYPLVLKPDVGQRGAGVKLVQHRGQAESYLNQTSAALIVQRYVPGPKEAGIFYYRFPHESTGHLFAITEKIFPFITGDGQSTISELIWNDQRARFMAEKYLARLRGRENQVLKPEERLRLVQAGNHAEGCIFRDGMRLWTPALAERIDAISKSVPGVFIGRYDIRYESEEDLRAGRNFQIIELNGAASEATSIYDARNSLWAAYKTLFKQWDLVFAIGAANRARGVVSTPVLVVWQKWREYSRMALTYPAAD